MPAAVQVGDRQLHRLAVVRLAVLEQGLVNLERAVQLQRGLDEVLDPLEEREKRARRSGHGLVNRWRDHYPLLKKKAVGCFRFCGVPPPWMIAVARA